MTMGMSCRFLILFLGLSILGACVSKSPKRSSVNVNEALRESLNFKSDLVLSKIKSGFRDFNNERVAVINVHDFPDSAIISAKSKLNPPDIALNEARLIQQDRAEILRQAIENYCDGCENIEVILPIEVFTEKQLNFFFDKIFLKQEVRIEEIQNLRKDLAKYSVLVLILSSENYEKNRGYNKQGEVVALTETEIKSENYVFHLNNNTLLYRSNDYMISNDFIFYQKNSSNTPNQTILLKNVTDSKISRLLNDIKYDDVYPYPLPEESLTLFYYFYNQVVKNIYGEINE